MENKKNKQKKSTEKKELAVLPVLVALIFLFVMVVIMGLALAPEVSEKYRTVFRRVDPVSYSGESQMKKFSSYNELKKFLEEGAANSSAVSGSAMLGGFSRQEVMFDNASKSGEIGAWASPSAVSEGTGGGDYSTTNVQVAGVDEGDIVKTDGEYIYAVSGNEVVIAKAYPADDSEITARIKFDSSPSGMYLNGNKLAIYGRDYNIYERYKDTTILPRKRNNQFTFFKVYDISDKSNPKEERSIDFEGDYTNSRMIGDYIYFVTSKYYSYYSGYDDELPIPLILENNKIVSGGENATGRAFPSIYYFDIPYYSYNFMTVSAVDISNANKKINNEIYLLDSSQNNMFVSKDNIYITFVKRISEEELMIDVVKEMILPKLSKRDRERIAEIEKTKNSILSPREKIEKIGMIIEKFGESLSEEEEERFKQELEEKAKQKFKDISKELEKTVIHKINIDNGILKYQTAGEVPGVILNQFSMDEDKGYFRIATTKNRSWLRFNGREEQQSYSNLYVLDDKMKVVGKVEKLAEGEKIYSVRFMQNRAYLVTFKQVDPLFVIDLSNPTNPKVLGELKIPGYSSYLHPYDETILIGLGKDSGDWDAKLKLSLFDVSSVGDPKEIDTYILEGRRSGSIALNDHKAFLFSKDKNLLVIPVSYEDRIIWDIVKKEEKIAPRVSEYFRGAAVFHIDKKGFKLQGVVDHSDGSNRYDYQSAVKRSLYIEDILYTLSQQYLKMNKLDNLEEVSSLILSGAKKQGIAN